MEPPMKPDVINFSEERIRRLPARELASRLMSFPAKRRLHWILDREDAPLVVACLPDHDFYLTIKEVGAEDSLPLLALARVEQIQHLLDLECWRKDEISPGSALEWLDRLFRSNGRKFLQWLYHADFEFIVVLFKKWIRVFQAPEDVDLTEIKDRLPPHTLDDQYFWDVRYPQHAKLIGDILRFLFEVHYGFYRELMNHVVWALETEVLEEAYRFHRGRLEDRAIPDYYEALDIYRPLDVKALAPRKRLLGSAEKTSSPPPSFALMALPENPILTQALSEIQDPPTLDQVKMELAALANKIMVADRLSPDDTDAVRSTLHKVSAYLNLALELLCKGQVGGASRILREAYLEHLFRIAHTHITKVATRLKAMVKKGWLCCWPERTSILDSPWAENVEALLQPTPRIYQSSHPIGVKEGDLIATSQDLTMARHVVDVVESLETIFHSMIVDPAELQATLWRQGQVGDLPSVTLGSLLITSEVRFLWKGVWSWKPIPVSSWMEVYPFTGLDRVRRALARRVDMVAENHKDKRILKRYIRSILDRYEEEIRGLDPCELPDPKLFPLVLFQAPH